MKLIGLTGGIGTGKSTVAGLLRQRGWTVLASDETARTIMDTDKALHTLLQELFGADVLRADGSIDRPRIATMIFGDTDAHRNRKRRLEQAVHPLVLERHLAIIEEERAAGTPVVAIDSALLYEIGLEDGFDWVVVVDASDDVRVDRVVGRSGLSPDEVRARMDEQMPMAEKRGAADFVIDNSGDLAALERATGLIAMVIEALPDPDSQTPGEAED